jgi:hypothetical protein
MSILTTFCFAKIFFVIKFFCFYFRACLKKAFCKMCVTICGKFVPDEGVVAGYGNRIRDKSPTKWGVQIAGMIFQTRSRAWLVIFGLPCYHYQQVYRDAQTIVPICSGILIIMKRGF